MKALYYPRLQHGYGNVTFAGAAFPQRGGKWPAAHPCSANPKPLVWSREDQPLSDDPLGRLRARGYMASCFPEGDGIAFDPPDGWTDESVRRDFSECLGFEFEAANDGRGAGR